MKLNGRNGMLRLKGTTRVFLTIKISSNFCKRRENAAQLRFIYIYNHIIGDV